jgi:hypothetical protein
LKELIGAYLAKEADIINVAIDEVYRNVAISNKWRKPDVLGEFPGKKIAFELQLSTTYLSVIVARTLFYKQQNVFLLWIFPNFSVNSDIQKFTQKDVYYNNNFNVFVFDIEAREKSKQADRLFFKCFYQEHFIQDMEIANRWQNTFVCLDDITFNTQTGDCYYIDADTNRKELRDTIEKQKAAIALLENEKKKERNVAAAVKYVRDQYKLDGIIPAEEYNPFDGMEGDVEAEVNEHLKFATENVSFITELFEKRNKRGFLKFICEEDKINIDLNLVKIRALPVLREIVHLDDYEEFHYYLACLFRKGYKILPKDQEIIDNLYDKNYFNQTEYEREAIRRWGLCGIMTNLKTREWAFEVITIQKVLLSIASVKIGKPIGYAFTNLLQVTHSFLEFHKEFGKIYLLALEVYGQFDNHLKEDKTAKFQKKLVKFNLENPVQTSRYNGLLFELFPELIIHNPADRL